MATYCMLKEGPALYLECQECLDKQCEYFYCLVVGSRTFDDYELLKRTLDRLLVNYSNVVIVSGGANGADSLAERYAKERGCILKIFPAKWALYGKQAGYIRNKEMHEYIAKAKHRGVCAFWDGISKGTAHSFDLAKQYNNQLKIIKF